MGYKVEEKLVEMKLIKMKLIFPDPDPAAICMCVYF